MNTLYETTHEGAVTREKLEMRVTFFLVTVGVFALTFGFFFLIDFLPEKPETPKEAVVAELPVMVATTTASVPEEVAVPVEPYPVRLVIPSLKRDVAVLNPESRSVNILDTALLSGAVRHPDSADFESIGTILLFGHSSYLPNVINKNFQAFNGIQKLTWGDEIRLYSVDMEYIYNVDRVYEVSANTGEVGIQKGSAKLVLVTCDSFGAKTDRFVVEASLVKSVPIPEESENANS